MEVIKGVKQVVNKKSFYYMNQSSLDTAVPISKRKYECIKRCMDILLSIVFLMITFPLFLILIPLIRRDGGSAFYVQTRIKKDGIPFRMYKFRSMCIDAENMQKELFEKNEMDGPVFKIRHDPRVTKTGRFIRKFSLDELPQLYNVLKGDMSIVGPRPPLVNEVAQYNAYQKERLRVPQGLTCYWQVQGRNTLSFDKWMELDLKYIQERGLWTDFKIILATIPAVLFGKGAN